MATKKSRRCKKVNTQAGPRRMCWDKRGRLVKNEPWRSSLGGGRALGCGCGR
jgi:hypothetical protein